MSIFSTLKARRTCTRVFGGNCVLHQKLHKVAMVKFFPEGACNYNALTQTFFGIQDKSVDLHLIFEISSSQKNIFELDLLLHFVAFFHVASLFSTGVDNKKGGVDNKKALELTNSTVFP